MTPSPRTAVPENFPDSTDHIPLLLGRHEPLEPAAAAHLARLCLDLQLDALLLTLGAGAASEPGREALPWRRWLTEDVTLAVELARTALAGGEDLPGRLGGRTDGEGQRVVEDLSAHYLAMHTMLLDLAGSTFGSGLPGSRLGQALEHCRRRLQELDAVSGPSGSSGAPAVPPSRPSPRATAEPVPRVIDLRCPGERTQYLAGQHLG